MSIPEHETEAGIKLRVAELQAQVKQLRGEYAEADWARTGLQEIVNEKRGQLDAAQLALHRYGRHHDNCETLNRRVKRHKHCTCGYIEARHHVEPERQQECKQCVTHVVEG
jgi:hypothetical protein